MLRCAIDGSTSYWISIGQHLLINEEGFDECALIKARCRLGCKKNPKAFILFFIKDKIGQVIFGHEGHCFLCIVILDEL